MRRLLACWVLALPLVAHADAVVLHERVEGLEAVDTSTIVSADGSSARGLVYDGQLISAPDASEGVAPALRAPSTAARDAVRPDRATSEVAVPPYVEVFSPSLRPFKRGAAFDAVVLDAHGVPTLEVADTAPVAVAVLGLGPEDPERARFFGRVELDFRRGTRVQLPTVAAEARILTAEVDPPVALRFERDSADNLYAVVDAPLETPLHLRFLVDAPARYFGAAIPARARSGLGAPPMPQAVRRAGLAFARELGVRDGDDLPTTLSLLVEHFRSFEVAREPSFDTGDIYLDLARGGVGVCRHRAYAFVITAQALGIPARYVHNEVHAWVEVLLGPEGYLRIDLGGAPPGADEAAAADAPRYRPRVPDTLPHPSGYGEAGQETASVSPRTAAAEQGDSGLTVRLEDAPVRVYRGRAIVLRGRITDADGEGIDGLRVEVGLEADAPVSLGATVTRRGGRFEGRFFVPLTLPVGEYALRVRTPGDAQHGPATAR